MNSGMYMMLRKSSLLTFFLFHNKISAIDDRLLRLDPLPSLFDEPAILQKLEREFF